MDNLRVAVIAGVIVVHASTAYILRIDWYYEERTANPWSEAVLAVAVLPVALFAMAALFLVAGLLSARSLARRGPAGFARGRLVRLGIPLALFIGVLGPVTSLIGARAEGSPAAAHAAAYFIQQVERADTGPMWFVVALLAFSLAYAGWRTVRPLRAVASQRLRPRHLLLAGGLIVVASFVVRMVWPFASDTPISLNLWEWPQMAVMFGFGAVAGERSWLDPPPPWLPVACVRAGGVGVVGILAVGALAVTRGEGGAFLGGWDARALAEPLCEAALAVSMSLWVTSWFARHVTYDGSLARRLARASFTAYVLHPPVIVGLSSALMPLGVVVEVKFVLVAALGVVASYASGWLVAAGLAGAAANRRGGRTSPVAG
jgi:glucans biosynthesis protein C